MGNNNEESESTPKKHSEIATAKTVAHGPVFEGVSSQ